MSLVMSLPMALGDRLAGLPRWWRLVAALIAGALGTLAMAPFFILPALLIAYLVLAWLESGSTSVAQDFWLGCAFGLGFHVSGLHWIYFAYVVPPADFAAFGAPSVLGLSALMAVFYGAALALHRLALRYLPPSFGHGVARLLLLAGALAIFEWLRGHVMTGFPWNQPAHALLGFLPLAQAASVLGAYGLNLLVLLICLLLAAPGLRAIAQRQRRRALWAALALLAVMAGGGTWRILANDRAAYQPDIYLRIVQPNIEQSEKWLAANRDATVDKLLRLSAIPSGRKLTVVIWPETALIFPLNRFPWQLERIGRAAPPGGYLLTGAPRQENLGGILQTFNSLLAIDDKGQIVASYDKAHLVPFGEYVPLEHLLGIGDTIGRGSFAAGPGPRTLALPGLAPFSPMICYEVIFAGDAVAPGARPSWLLNITNDAWFGLSIGPHQHLAAARLRAIEEGLPLVRSANTGISAIIDGLGRERAQLGLAKEGVIDDFLPAALSVTPYSAAGDWMFVLALAVVFLTAFYIQKRARSV